MLCSFSRIISSLINLFTVLHVNQKEADERLTLSSSVLRTERNGESVITDNG
jgi:hypothetical protein